MTYQGVIEFLGGNDYEPGDPTVEFPLRGSSNLGHVAELYYQNRGLLGVSCLSKNTWEAVVRQTPHLEPGGENYWII